jgi:hypothetical protein
VRNELSQIILNTDSCFLTVSDYLKDGGGSGLEWPWKVMLNSNNEGDKFITPHSTGWICYDFETKAVLIRGYGIKSGNDEPSRDPVDWKIYIKDAVSMG